MTWRMLFPDSPARLSRRHVIASYAIAAGTLAGVIGPMLACGGGQRGDLQVMSFTPQGPVDKAELVEIRFDRPVVAEAAVGKPVDPSTVTITPPVAWTGHWQDRQTLSIEPTTPFAASTRYSVSLGGALAQRTAGFGFSFVHRPIAVEGVWGVDPMSLQPDGAVPISFNQPVRPVDAARHCKLVGDGGDLALVAPETTAAASLSLQPAAALTPGAHYTLTCAELAGAGGNATLETPYTLAVRARPRLTITQLSPTGDDVPADEVALTITFATPVTLEAVRKAVTSTPAIRGLDQGYLNGDGTEYKVTADLETETSYKLQVGRLVDTFGQQLAKPVTHAFTTGDARPRLSMERGIYALEASAKGYPVWSRNVSAFDVECARIPRDRIVQVLTTDMNYDPWGGNDDDRQLDWNKLQLAPKRATTRTGGKNKWRLHELPLGSTCGGTSGARGVFLAEIASDDIKPDPNRTWWNPRRNRVLANVTDLGVLIKTGTSSGLVWVTSLSTGAPVGGAKVAIYTPAGKQVWVDLTGADGVVKIPGSALLKHQQPVGTGTNDGEDDEGEGDWDSYRSQRLIAIVERGPDLAVVDGNWSNGIQIWNFGVSEDRRGGATKIRGFIQSDRGLYRPGEQVHFKGLVREVSRGMPPRVPAKKPVEIEVQDARGQTVLTTTTRISKFGGFAFDLQLAKEASLGDYYVRATVADQVFREKFSVEEFRPATFELGLVSGQKSPRPGQRLTFELDAKYLFGSPVAAAKVDWSLRKRNHPVRFKGWEQYTFSANPYRWWWYDRDDDYGEFLSDGTGATNAQGKLTVVARDSATTFDGPVDYILTANVTDSADQTMGKSTVVTAHKTALYLGMHANEYVQAVGMPFGVNLVALTPTGARATTKAKLTVTRTMRRCAWIEQGARSFQRCESSDHELLSRDVTIAATGSHVERIFPTEPGDYVIKVEAKDVRGNTITAASGIWVIGKGEAFWSGDEGDRMTLIASKPSYKPGETARLVAQANLVKPTALITIERDGIIEARVKRLGSASEGVELAIADAWAPNVYASVALVSGRHGPGDRNRPRFKLGLVELKVSSDHKQLDVALALDRATVRPGERVSGTIKVTHGGTPVQAEVSLSAADEGVLQLISYQTPNPMKTFYASYGLGVDAGTNWNRVARLADPESGDPDEGGDGGGSDDGGQRVRSKFVSSAHWAPMLVTNERGEIPFSFVAPDNLTAFRLMAVAADLGDRFGAGELRLTVNKPLMAAPALPRFLRSGDAASVGIVVHNRTDAAGTATVTAKAIGATLDASTRRVAVPANGSVRVRFAAKASDNASVAFQFGVALGSERDAVRVTVPIDRPRIIDHRLLVERPLAGGETWTGSLGTAPGVLRDESTLVVTVDRTGVGDLAPSLRALVEYPYGCLEQTMSRFIPLVAARDLANTLDDPSLKGTKASKFIRAGTQKVIRHQQGDGLFSLWPQSQTYPHLAAYALWGLTVAERAGEQVPAEVFDRGLAALRGWANQGAIKPDGDGATAAMAAYVMAMRGKPDASLNARLFAVRAGLPRWGQAFLLRAMHASKADRAQVTELERQIEAGVIVRDGKAMVRESFAGHEYEMYMTSDVRATAMTLAALLEVNPTSKLIPPLVLGLKSERTKVGTWASTQENLWSLVALAQYGRRGATGEATATVRVGGQQVYRKKIIGSEIATARVPLAAARGDQVEVKVDAGVHVSVRVTEARVDGGRAVSNGFTIARRYLDASGAEKASYKAGEMVTVVLAITADQTRKWVALVDPIPAGFEVVNPKLAAGGQRLQPPAAGGDPWAQRRQAWRNAVTWDHQELRDDRVLWFADHMSNGSYVLTYQARATIDGTFAVMPATIEAMYHPDVRGRTQQTKVVVTP